MSPSTQSSGYRGRFVGDRYERLEQGADVLALDPALRDATFPFDEDGLRALVAAIADHRLFDHLSGPDADIVTAMVLLDFHRGTDQIASRILQLLVMRNAQPGYDILAVISGLAAVLALMVKSDTWLPATTGEWS